MKIETIELYESVLKIINSDKSARGKAIDIMMILLMEKAKSAAAATLRFTGPLPETKFRMLVKSGRA